MQMVNWKLKKWSWRKHSSCFRCPEAEIQLTSLKAAFQHCFIRYRGSQKLESLHISWEKRNFQLWVKGGPCFPPKGLGPSARREEMLQQDHGKDQRFPQVGKVQILWLFFCRKKMFQLAYVFCFNSVCSLCLAGLGDGDLGFGAHLCAWMKSECVCLEGNVLLVLLAVTLLLLIERSLLWLAAEITGIFNRPTDSPWREIKNTEGKILR